MGKKDYNIHTPEHEYKKELKRVQQFIRRAKKRGFVWDKNPIPKKPKKITQKSVERLRKITPERLYQKSKYIVPETGEITTGVNGKKIIQKGTTDKPKKPKRTQDKKTHTPKNDKQQNENATPENTSHKKDVPTTKPKVKNINGLKYGMVDDYNAPINESYLPNQSDMILGVVHNLIDKFQPLHYTKSLAQLKTQHKNQLELILNSAIAEHGENNVANRLQNIGADEITNIIYAILYDSDAENVRHNLVRFATILKGSALTPEESIELAELSEYFESWEAPK